MTIINHNSPNSPKSEIAIKVEFYGLVESALTFLISCVAYTEFIPMKQTSAAHRSKAAKTISVFVRNNKKQALLIHTPPRTSLSSLTAAINQRMRVPPSQQLLFLNGQPISQSTHHTLHLTDRTVMHLIDRRNLTREITISIRRLTAPTIDHYTIPASQVIQDFIVRHIREEEADKMFLVYTGRQLERSNSFEEEFVQNGSQLFCLHQDKDEVKGERREHYKRKIKEEREEKYQMRKRKISQGKGEEQEGGDLWNYLPRDSQEREEMQRIQKQIQKQKYSQRVRVKRKEEEKQFEEHPQTQEHEQSKPNFKKKQPLQQLTLSHKPSQKKSHLQANLSQLNQNNFQQHLSGLNSQYFNDGSSISQIMAYDSHNPESNKKLQQGSMFNSAYMGLNNQPSIVNNPNPTRITQTSKISQQSYQKSKQGQSLNFDTRAPEMMITPTDRQFTVLERQIQEVTEQSIEDESSREKQRDGDSPGNKKQGDGSGEHSQFQFGEIENHLLSASTEMRVGDPTSPVKKDSKNQILIEDQEQSEDRLTKTQKSQKTQKGQKYLERQRRYEPRQQVQLFIINQNSQQSIQSRHTRRPSRDRADTFDPRQSRQSSKQDEPEQMELILIEQNSPSQVSSHQVANQKQQCETNNPSSSSNFFSKHSSRVNNNNNTNNNQYQFGAYDRKIARPGIQSRNVQRTTPKEVHPYESTKSQSSKIHKNDESEHQSDSEGLELQVVELPLELKAMERTETYKMSSLVEKQREGKSEIGGTEKNRSKIDELNKLVDDDEGESISNKDEKSLSKQDEASNSQQNNGGNTDNRQKDMQDNRDWEDKDNRYKEGKDNRQNEEKGDSALLSDQSSVNINTSLNNRMDPDHLRESQQSLQQVSIKKTIMSYVSGTKLYEHDIKATPHKQNYAPANYIFRADLTHFDPLDFYVGLLQKEGSFKRSVTG